MTGRWLTPNAARRTLQITWGELCGLVDSGELKQELIGDHYSISEESVFAYAAEHQPEGAAIPVRQGPADRDVDEEYGREQADYEYTPNDEGDETPCP